LTNLQFCWEDLGEIKMAAFTTRVELHDAVSSDYDKLHEEMKNRGFKQTVRSDDGITYQLPDAEYNYSGDITRLEVRDKAKAAASQVKKSFGILVTESDGRAWYGLEKV
jgi:hypothetical protein